MELPTLIKITIFIGIICYLYVSIICFVYLRNSEHVSKTREGEIIKSFMTSGFLISILLFISNSAILLSPDNLLFIENIKGLGITPLLIFWALVHFRATLNI